MVIRVCNTKRLQIISIKLKTLINENNFSNSITTKSIRCSHILHVL